MWQDFKFASRQLLRHPVSNLIIIATIALLLGAVSTIYSTIRSQAKRQLPFPDAHQLVKVWRIAEDNKVSYYPYELYREFGQRLDSFELLGATEMRRAMTMTGQGEPTTFGALKSSTKVLWMTEIPPRLGRLFNETDEEPGNDRVVILTDKVWKEKFEKDPDIIGRSIRLNDKEYEIVGVLDPRMDRTHLGSHPLWLPLVPPSDQRLATTQVNVVGRLREGINRKHAAAEIETVAKHLEAEHSPSDYERRISPKGFDSAELVALSKNLSPTSGDTRREMFGILVFSISVLACVVLIACFNVTNLLLLRATSRAREIAIRLSIGASRIRIIRQLLSESILLAVIGSILGLTVAQAIWTALRTQNFNPEFDIGLYVTAAMTAIALGALVGILPAIQSSRAEFTRELKDGGATSAGKRRHRTRNVLVTAQVAMAMILCVGSIIMTRSYVNMHRTELGFDPADMMMVSAQLKRPTYSSIEDSILYADKGLQSLREHPGVEEAAVSFSGILSFFSLQEELRFHHSLEDIEKTVKSSSWFTTPNLPAMVGVSVVRGRNLSDDENSLQNEILINELFVSEYLDGIEPIGLSLHIQTLKKWMTVVGIVRDRSPLTSFQELKPEFYANYRHAHYAGETSFLVKTKGNVKQSAAPIREMINRIDRNQPVSQSKYLPDLMEERLAGPKSAMIFLTLLACFGMLIALLGIYGVVSFSVAERTHEVGIRMALGAGRNNILHLLMSQGIRLLLLGGVPGILIAFAITQGIPTEMLYKLTPRDPISYLLVILLVSLSGFIACFLPASKATRLKPMSALRWE
ncbi:MAG: FtsX-like permease family protein [Verrucomicrobia bacterium]|nr:FtsX-like permease family protein [Verrucomicrobiota bacterium]